MMCRHIDGGSKHPRGEGGVRVTGLGQFHEETSTAILQSHPPN